MLDIWELNTVPTPLKAADTMQTLCFEPLDYCIKRHTKSFLIWKLRGLATNPDRPLMTQSVTVVQNIQLWNSDYERFLNKPYVQIRFRQKQMKALAQNR